MWQEYSSDGQRECIGRPLTPAEQAEIARAAGAAHARATVRHNAISVAGVYGVTARRAANGGWYLVLENGTICCPLPGDGGDTTANTAAYWQWRNGGGTALSGVELLPPTDGWVDDEFAPAAAPAATPEAAAEPAPAPVQEAPARLAPGVYHVGEVALTVTASGEVVDAWGNWLFYAPATEAELARQWQGFCECGE